MKLLQLTSPSFAANHRIPRRFSGEGEDVSPRLEWSNAPYGCKGYVLLCEDPDAPKSAGMEHPFVHWLIYNLGPDISVLPEALPQKSKLILPISATQGINSFGQVGYRGPMPPEGHGLHRYNFTLHALRTDMILPTGLTRDKLLPLVRGHIDQSAVLMGCYERAARKTA